MALLCLFLKISYFSQNQQAMEERRVVYVGGIEEKMTKQELRNKFLKFGNIESVSLFFRSDRCVLYFG